jgi:predicted ArsR family transcriptional regulator
MRALSPRQEVTLAAIKRLGRPTVRELADELGISVNGAANHLKALRNKGHVTWEPKKARTLQVLDPRMLRLGERLRK